MTPPRATSEELTVCRPATQVNPKRGTSVPGGRNCAPPDHGLGTAQAKSRSRRYMRMQTDLALSGPDVVRSSVTRGVSAVQGPGYQPPPEPCACWLQAAQAGRVPRACQNERLRERRYTVTQGEQNNGLNDAAARRMQWGAIEVAVVGGAGTLLQRGTVVSGSRTNALQAAPVAYPSGAARRVPPGGSAARRGRRPPGGRLPPRQAAPHRPASPPGAGRLPATCLLVRAAPLRPAFP
jgi:hypothetical protein